MADRQAARQKLFLGNDRLKQVNVTDGLQNLLDMWWSQRGNAQEKPILTSATIHYRVVSNRRKRRKR
ncbi:hypothetical protein LCGC14_0990280 [marine sediment metagenome]|uniref:Uncharacterized protein n=1 Tax=marine sediment metagenome TaxID=412755 RepID=A0A0F9QPE8_9ZZZZ